MPRITRLLFIGFLLLITVGGTGCLETARRLMPSLFSVTLCYVERARDAPVRIEPEERATSMARRARHRDRGLGARPRADLGGELEHGEGAETGETPDTGADTDVDTD